MQVGEVIICSPKDFKAHLVMTNCEGLDFGGFVWPYNILTRIQQRLKGEETLWELVQNKRDMASLKISEDEARTVYTFYIVLPGLIGGKVSTKSDIGPLLDYTKWYNKSLHTGLGYDIKHLLNTVRG